RRTEKNGDARICHTCTSRTASAVRKIHSAGGRALRDNVGMLAHVSTSNRGVRGDRRESLALRSRRLLRLGCWCLFVWPIASHAQPRFTFTRDVAPIVWSRCATCHRPGEIGPFSLITYDDVKRRATQIAAVTARRVMPPWKPQPGKGEFQDARRLSDRELETLQDWIADGAPEGAAADLPPPPSSLGASNTTWQLGTPDLIVSMPQPYAVRA